MNGTLQIKSDKWIIQVNERSRLLKTSVPAVVKSEAGLWVKQVIKLTPPTSRISNGEDGYLKPKAVGEKAVRRDILRSVVPVDPYWPDAPKFMRNTRIRALLTGTARGKKRKALNKAAFEAILKKIGEKGGKYGKWKVVDSFTPQLHTSQKNGRGRVGSTKRIFLLGASEVRKYWRYMKKTIRHVGRLKAGFAPAYFALGGKSLQAGVRRHLSGARGGVRLDIRDESTKPFVEVTNFAQGAGNPRVVSICRNAFNVRAEAMKRRTHLIAKGFAKADVALIKRVRDEHGSIDNYTGNN